MNIALPLWLFHLFPLGLIYLHFELIFRSRPVVAVAVFVAVKLQQPVCHNRRLPALIVSSSHVIRGSDPDDDTLQVINNILKPFFA